MMMYHVVDVVWDAIRLSLPIIRVPTQSSMLKEVSQHSKYHSGMHGEHTS